MKSILGILHLILTTISIGKSDWIWSNLVTTSNNLYSVNVIDTSRIWIFGDYFSILESNDNGINWFKVPALNKVESTADNFGDIVWDKGTVLYYDK